MTKMVDYYNRWTLITGASRGIGKKIAYEMAEKGSNLVLVSRDKSHTECMEQELSKTGIKIISYGVELSQRESIQIMLEDLEVKKIVIDTVFNVAAVNSNVYNYFNTSIEEYEMIFKVNVFAIGQICNWFIPKMLQRGFGRIINITSSIQNEPKAMVYASSKAALNKLTMELAYALNGSNVMINLADPGWVKTDMGTINAPNEVESCFPGIILGAFLDDGVSGRMIKAYEYCDLSMEQAINQASDENGIDKGLKITSMDDFVIKFDAYINSTKKHLIFGGGKQAQFCSDVLKHLGVKIDGVIISRYNGLKYFNGIPLYTLDSTPFDRNECIMLIAIVENGMATVNDMLIQYGFEDICQFRIAYCRNCWLDKDGKPVSQAFEERKNTFEGGGI